MKKKLYVATGVALILGVGLLVPVQTVMVPEWQIRVVDETGKPYIEQKVRQFCNDYTLDIDLCTDQSADQFTDKDGYVRFSEKAYSASTALRIFATVKKFILIYIAHDSMGTSVYVYSSGPTGYTKLEYTPDMAEPPTLLLLKSENAP